MSVADRAMAGMIKNLLGIEPEQVLKAIDTIYRQLLDVQQRMERIEQGQIAAAADSARILALLDKPQEYNGADCFPFKQLLSENEHV